MNKIHRKNRELEREVREIRALLRSLHDLQNGPPLEKYRDEWLEVMETIRRYLTMRGG